MDTDSAGPDLHPDDAIVTLTDVRPGDIVRLERLDPRTVGLRVVGAGDPAAGFLFRVESGDHPGAVRLVQVRGPGPLN